MVFVALEMVVWAQELILVTRTDRKGIVELSAVRHEQYLATKLSHEVAVLFELFLDDLHVLTCGFVVLAG